MQRPVVHLPIKYPMTGNTVTIAMIMIRSEGTYVQTLSCACKTSSAAARYHLRRLNVWYFRGAITPNNFLPCSTH